MSHIIQSIDHRSRVTPSFAKSIWFAQVENQRQQMVLTQWLRWLWWLVGRVYWDFLNEFLLDEKGQKSRFQKGHMLRISDIMVTNVLSSGVGKFLKPSRLTAAMVEDQADSRCAGIFIVRQESSLVLWHAVTGTRRAQPLPLIMIQIPEGRGGVPGSPGRHNESFWVP